MRNPVPHRRHGNMGQSSLRRKRVGSNPMATYDALPKPLRRWLAQAALPWSPSSAHRIWLKSQAKGMTDQETLNSLAHVEKQTLRRDKITISVDYDTV
ncbi:MAG: DUF6525 family protein [Pseudomonadota bacterium]